MPAFADYVAKPPPSINYYANAELVETVFGSLKVLRYEDLAAASGSLGEAFYAALGYSLSGHTPTANARVSLSPEETLVKNAFNARLGTRADSQHFIAQLHRPIMQETLRAAYPNPPYSLWPDAATRQAFLESRADDLERLRQRYFPGHKVLFETALSGSASTPAPEPSAELLKQLEACVPSHGTRES